MRIQCFHHIPWEGRAFLPEWAATAGHEWDVTLVPQAERLPDPSSFDALVIMGGPMSLCERDRPPWLSVEKAYLERVLQRELPFLGICLGAQMLAEIYGGRVSRGPQSEIGWFPLRLAQERHDTWIGDALPENLTTFFWHDDVFETPREATRIAGTAASEHQAFVLGSSLALQFHLEVTPEWAAHLATRDADQLVPGRYVQSAADILGQPVALYQRNNAAMNGLLTRWLESATLSEARAG